MNWDRIEGNWKQIKGGIKELIGEIYGDQFDVIVGQSESRAGRHQEAYGITREHLVRPYLQWPEQQD